MDQIYRAVTVIDESLQRLCLSCLAEMRAFQYFCG